MIIIKILKTNALTNLLLTFKEIETLHEMITQYQEMLVQYNQIKGHYFFLFFNTLFLFCKINSVKI